MAGPPQNRMAWLSARPGGAGSDLRTRPRRRLQILRIALPLLALATLALILLWPQLSGRESGFRLSFDRIEAQSDDIVLTNARYHGTDARGQPFMVSAERAVQDKADARLVHLKLLQADISMASGEWLALTADAGLYNQETRILTLEGNLAVFSDRGHEGQGERAVISLEEGLVRSDRPVTLRTTGGILQAGAAEFRQSDRRILFSNKVKLRIDRRAMASGEKRGDR